jgi:hypothetical protein
MLDSSLTLDLIAALRSGAAKMATTAATLDVTSSYEADVATKHERPQLNHSRR